MTSPPVRAEPLTAAPATVRGRLLVLTSGARGTPEDTLAAGAALLLDATLEGLVAVEGRRTFGLDRRRVVPGPTAPGRAVAAPQAGVLRRLEIVGHDTPWGWCERLATFAADATADELVAGGVVRPIPVPWWRRALRHRTLVPVDPAAADAVRAGLVAVARGGGATPADVALAAAMHGCDVLDGTLPWREGRRLDRALQDATDALPASARLVAQALRERRRRADGVGTWYADD